MSEGKKEAKEETQEVPDDLLREDLVKEREAKLIRRLSRKSLKSQQLRSRPKSAKLSVSAGSTPVEGSLAAVPIRKSRPKSTGAMEPITGLREPLTAEEKEKRKSLLLEKKKKLLLLQKVKAAKLAKSAGAVQPPPES